MLMTTAFLLIFFGLPMWGGYTGDNLALWAFVGIAMLAVAGGCMWLENLRYKKGGKR